MRIGDLLFCWQQTARPSIGRAASWNPPVKIDTAIGWKQAPSEIWYGYPLQEGRIDHWQYWLLGELVGPVESQLKRLFSDLTVADGLNGHFLIIAFNHESRQWHIWTDRLGTLHAYYSRNESRAALGTFCPAVAATTDNYTLDWYGIAGFFSWGFFPQDHTQFANVRILRPAIHLVLDAHGKFQSEERYWRWQHVPDRKRSFADTVTEFANIFHQIVAEQIHNVRAALPISGGLDSRSIVAAATNSQACDSNLWAFTYGYSADSLETQIAAEIARARGLQCHSYIIQPYLFREMERVLACTEGFQDLSQCRQAAIAGPLSINADVVLAGHWGDVWLDDMGMTGQVNSDITTLALKKLNKRGRNWLLEQFGLQAVSEELKAQVNADLNNYAYLTDEDFRLKAYKSDQWSWRWTTASLRMYQTSLFPRLTFYDNRLVDFFTTVPSDFLVGRRLQIEYLKQFAPDLAQVKWQPFQANLFQYQYFNSLLLPARVWRKVLRRLNRRPVISRNWEVQFGTVAGQSDLRATLLGHGQKIHDHVSVAAIDSLLKQFEVHPNSAIGYSVSMLFTFASWLEKYG